MIKNKICTVNSLVKGHPQELIKCPLVECPPARIIPVSGHQRKKMWMSTYGRTRGKVNHD